MTNTVTAAFRAALQFSKGSTAVLPARAARGYNLRILIRL